MLLSAEPDYLRESGKESDVWRTSYPIIYDAQNTKPYSQTRSGRTTVLNKKKFWFTLLHCDEQMNLHIQYVYAEVDETHEYRS